MTQIHKGPGAPGLAQLFDAARQQEYAEAAKAAVRNDPFSRAATLAFQNLEGVRYEPGAEATHSTRDASRPQLTPPQVKLASDPKQAQDAFTLLMASLIALLGEVDSTAIQSRMQMLKSMAKATAEGHTQRSASYNEALVELEAAVQAGSLGQQQLAAALAALEHAAQRLANAEERLAGTPPGSPEHEQALQLRNQAQADLDGARQAHARAVTVQANALNSAQAAAVKADLLAVAIQATVLGPLPASVRSGVEKQLSASATLILLMMQFAELMGEAAEMQLDMQQELFKEMQVARQAWLEQKSEEYLKQVEAAEKMSRIGGCVAKILGGIAMLIGAVVAVAGLVTGGAASVLGVALFAVGMTLTVTDMVVAEITGTSFMAQAMQPLMDAVILPAVQWAVEQFTKVFQALEDSGMLDFLNLPENFAQIAGAVVGTAVALVAMVAVVVVGAIVGGPAIGKLAEKLAGAAGQVLEKMIPRIIQHMATVAVETINAVLKQIAALLGAGKLQTALSVAKISLTITEVSGSVVAASLQSVSGVHRKLAADAEAEASLVQSISEQIRVLMTRLTELYIASTGQVSQTIADATDILARLMATAISIARKA